MVNKVIPVNMPHPMSAVGWDGTDFHILTIDAAGHLQVDNLSSALPTGAATEATLAEVSARVGDEAAPAAGSLNQQIAEISARIGDETGPAAGSLNELLRVIETDLANLMLYDRGLIKASFTGYVIIGAHGWTERYSYTVPAAKRGLVEAFVLTATLPDAGHIAEIAINIGVVAVAMLFVDPLSTKAHERVLNWSGAVWLTAGTIVTVNTYTDSGINIDFSWSAIISEFNA